MDISATCWEFLRSGLRPPRHFPIGRMHADYLPLAHPNGGLKQKRWTMPREEEKNKNSERSPLLSSGAEAAAGVSEPPDSRGAAAPGWTRAHSAHRSPPKAPRGPSVQPGASSSRGAPLGWLYAVGVSPLLFFDNPRHPTLSRHPEGEAKRRPHNPLSVPKEEAAQGGVSLFSQGTSERQWSNSLKLHRGRFRLDIRRNFFMEMVVGHWDGMPREVSKRCVEMVLKDLA